MELGDKMDLASYLLKPIQRMSKYALLLKDLIKECSQSQEQELSDLRTAEDMVKFQLRHGNDLLAMDAIRGCDVSSNHRHRGMCCYDEYFDVNKIATYYLTLLYDSLARQRSLKLFLNLRSSCYMFRRVRSESR